ncbi:MAG TPA: hypothetical protein ENH87_11400 [Pricia antarctica]|uniref:Uncharacterized protein n=1 Tax=Pricia antarctica TaxID=641691 RepID=A0A831VVK6_9FLAO|nr:hypothetical protein [Pricia antarctica]
MKKTIVSLLIVTLLCVPQVSEAQCAMCRAVLQSDGNTAAAEGINNGIVYLMAIPYIAIAVLFYFVFRKIKTKTTWKF